MSEPRPALGLECRDDLLVEDRVQRRHSADTLPTQRRQIAERNRNVRIE
jgi:hypothetical protein